MSWLTTIGRWRKKKSSINLPQNIYRKLVQIAEMNQLSLSETAYRLLEQGHGISR